MEQNRPAPRRALSPKERRRRHRIRLVRNWTVFLLSCGAVMAVMTGGILWLLPRAYALIAPPTAFEAREYEGGAETDLSDKRLMLVNANLPLTEEPTPELAVADDATGVSLEAEAAAAYREMAEAARQDEIELVLTAGYQDAAARQSAYEAAGPELPGVRLLGGRGRCQGCDRSACAGGQRICHRLRCRHPRGRQHGEGHRLRRTPRCL